MSHRKATGRGGCWCPTNILAVDGMGNASGCHRRVHENRDGEADTYGWSVKTAHNPAERPVLHALYGWVYLEVDGGLRFAERPAA